MLNFTVGPVQESDETLAIGARPTPYFRNASFSKIMLDNELMMKELSFAPADSRVVFLTASGTGAMEAAVMNSFTPQDKLLVVNGGSFGHRFVELCEIYEIPYTQIVVPFEEALTEDMLAAYDNQGYTGFLINMHETSVGKLYDMKIVSEFCKKNNLFLIVDAISAFLADELNMEELGVDIMLTGSQKALACPPGVSVLVMSSRAVEKVCDHPVRCMYLNLRDALINMERGQTPFTPAVGTLLQINSQLKQLVERGGAVAENRRIAELAGYFREKIKGMPFEITSSSLSNAVTPLRPIDGKSAYEIFEVLERDHGIWICPNGGEYRDTLFRVGHLGNLCKADYDALITALDNI